MNIRILIAAPLLWVSCHAQATEADNPHLRVLAASCAACHGYNGNSVGGTPVLAGLDRSHFILQMQSFRNGSRSSTVMHHHAKGLTEAEIEQLADYFAAQPRVTASVPQPLGGL
jgi:cytochrome subunit of sulfide dehydrogenase